MSDKIEPEFIQLFAEDAVVKLRKMGEQLLQLEGSKDSGPILVTLCRDTHSLKGAAGMVGLDHFADVAHALEDPLQRLRTGKLKPSQGLVDALLAGVDGMRAMVEQAAHPGGLAASAEMAQSIIAGLAGASGEDGAARQAPRKAPPKAPRQAAPPRKDAPEPQPEAPAAAPATMQIAVQRLDQIDRLVSEAAAAHLRIGLVLADEFKAEPETLPQYREMTRLLGRLQEVTMRARMVPLSTIASSLHRAVRDIANITGKDVRWEVSGDDTEIDRKLLEQLLDPLVHLVRNSVDHGLETPEERVAAGKPAQGLVALGATQHGSEIVISISDDGRGVDADSVRVAAQKAGIDTSAMTVAEVRNLILTSGLSTAASVTEISGRGVGMEVVRANVEAVRGRIELSTQPGRGTEFVITVPITLTIVECLMVESAGQTFAIPMQSVVHVLPPSVKDEPVAGRQMVVYGESAVPVYGLAETLSVGGGETGPAVVLGNGKASLAFRVRRLIGHRDMVIKGLSLILPRNDVVAGAAIEPDGAVVVVLDPEGMARRAEHSEVHEVPVAVPDARRKAKVLVVDDAMTVRELQRSILERAGYDVRLAKNGLEAMALLVREPSDLVLTDYEMPGMDGFALTESIRSHATLRKTPVVILTSHDAEADRQRGMAAGANAYIIKSGFDQQSLLSLVEKLLLGGTV